MEVFYNCNQAPSGGYSIAIWASGGIIVSLMLLLFGHRIYRRWRERLIATATAAAATATANAMTLSELNAKLAMVSAELASSRGLQFPAQTTQGLHAPTFAASASSPPKSAQSQAENIEVNESKFGGGENVFTLVIDGGERLREAKAAAAASVMQAPLQPLTGPINLPGEVNNFLETARAETASTLLSMLNVVGPAVPLIGIAVSTIAAVLQQVEAMRTTSEATLRLAARLQRLSSLVQRAGNDTSFAEKHTAIFEGLVATLRRAELVLVQVNKRSRLASFAMSSSDLSRLTTIDQAITLHVSELIAALQAETLTALRSLHAAASFQYISADSGAPASALESGSSLATPISRNETEELALPPFSVAMRVEDLTFDPPLEDQLLTAPRGTFGVVAFATWRQYNLPVAVKLVAARSTTGQAAMPILSWLTEADMMRRLREHRPQHIVSIYGIGVDAASNGEAKQYLVVMERLEGSLRAVLDSYLSKGRQPPLLQALQWLLQSARGLFECHEANVVHSDIKAANTLVDKRREAKIGDLGAGRVTRGLSATASLAGSSASGNARGSVLWLSSELIDDPEVLPSKQSDVFAWAVLCWEVLTCRLPYHSSDGQLLVNVAAPKHLMAIAAGTLRPDLAAVRPDAPPSIVFLMQRCWAADPRERPEMAEVVSVLESAAGAFRASRNASSEAIAAGAAADAKSDALRMAAAAVEAEDVRAAAADLAELTASVELMRSERIAALSRRREEAATRLRAEAEAEMAKLEEEAAAELAAEEKRAEEAFVERRRQQMEGVATAHARRLQECSAGLGEANRLRIIAEFEANRRAVEALVDEARNVTQTKLAAQLAARKEARLTAAAEAAASRRRQLDEQAAIDVERERSKNAREVLLEGLGEDDAEKN
jgi:hypothetical protein